tara:strand:+ start:164 stop:640 length:477 start_codon:yes stop_codon:yes gene_type:complete
MANITSITSRIQSYDNTFTGDYGSVNQRTMKRKGWEEACEYVNSVHPAAVATTTIVNGSPSVNTESFWGLDHFKPNIRDTILAGGSLVPYKCTKTDFLKYVVFVNEKIFKFSTVSDSYFEMAKGASEYFSASYYFEEVGDTTNHDDAESDGESYVDNY